MYSLKKFKIAGRHVSTASLFSVAIFVAYGYFFYFSQQSLLKELTSTKLASIQTYFEKKEGEEIVRLINRAESITSTIAKLSSVQLENAQTFNLQKEGLGTTMEPFMDYPEIAAIEVTDKENRPYAAMWRENGKNEFRANYSLTTALKQNYKFVVRQPAIANGQTQGIVTVYVDDKSLSLATIRIKDELRLSADTEVAKLKEHVRNTLITQVIVLMVGIAFTLFFNWVNARSFILIEKQRHQLEIFNRQLEKRVEERTKQLEEQVTKVSTLNKSMEIESAERKKAENKFRAIFENAADGIFQTSLSGKIIAANKAMAHIFGYVNAKELQLQVSDLLAEIYSSNAQREEALTAMEQNGSVSHSELSATRKDGGKIWISVTTRLVKDIDNQTRFYEGTIFDVTHRKMVEAELKLAASVFHNTMDGVMIVDTNGQIVSVNPAFTHITGYSVDEAVGKNQSMLGTENDGRDFYGKLWSTLVQNGRWEGEVWNQRKNGEAFLEWLSIGMVADDQGKPVRYVGVFNDITELRRKEERIRHMAFHDALTGLPNRALLFDRLEQNTAFALREKETLGVMFIDLDRFKDINDSLGHDIGDELLKEIANRLTNCLRKSDTVARMGGDEFVVILKKVEIPESYATLAQKIITSLYKPLTINGHTIQVNASIGIASFPEDGKDYIELMKHADIAMYEAKSAGRGTYRFFQPSMTKTVEQRLRFERELRNALPNNELELFFQPKIFLDTNRICGMEALIRWNHPEFGLVSPIDFIPLSEEKGIIIELGNWVLEEACRQYQAWQKKGLKKIKLAINISAKQLQQGDLVERVANFTKQYQIQPSDLEFELTESVIMANPEEISDVLNRLRKLGVTVAIDDFGTGYSSLAYLRRLPIDVLKIDRSFVKHADTNDGDAQIVKTIIALGQALKLSVVAEGVETESQAKFLRSCGCLIGQGYLYSKPQPAKHIETWLRDQDSGHQVFKIS